MLKLLDCTLRDGGYVNNWQFNHSNFDKIIVGLQKANVDIIEVGMMVKNSSEEFTTKFSNFEQIPKIPHIENSRTLFTVMFTMGEAKGIVVPPKNTVEIDAIRLAYFKTDYIAALKLAKELKEKGYQVFLQAMATFMYSDSELHEMIIRVNELQPQYFCMVDSFGVMYADDILHMLHSIDSALDARIGLGFHAHNNQQLALSNVITFISAAENLNRDICVDASIYGMGRGAGNVPLELLMQYLKNKKNANYDAEKILSLWNEYLIEDYKTYGWGYSWEYLLTAKNEINSAYIWYLKTKNINDMETTKKILNDIPKEWRYTLRRDVVDPLIVKHKGKC
ncbi:MAG: aldolase catalytic domain-containing protein [Selenomonadaceae bacterium]|nr:aldolase catalytic domain-containing protein [Selenomonadaceae bacterium]